MQHPSPIPLSIILLCRRSQHYKQRCLTECIFSLSFVYTRKLEMRLVDYIVSFFAVKSSCELMFERKERGLNKGTSDIIRLI